MKRKDYILSILLLLLVMAAGYFLGRGTCSSDGHVTDVIVKRDTIVQLKQIPPDTVMIVKPRLVFRRDTIIDSTVVIKYRDTAWTASDRVITAKLDTVHTEFMYPEMMFRHRFNYSTDSTRVITIFRDKIIVKERPWWETPVMILGAAAAGYVFGRLR